MKRKERKRERKRKEKRERERKRKEKRERAEEKRKERGRRGDEPEFRHTAKQQEKNQGPILFSLTEKRVACECAFGLAFIALSASLPRSLSFYRARAKKAERFSLSQRDEAAGTQQPLNFASPWNFNKFRISRCLALQQVPSPCSRRPTASARRWKTANTHELQSYSRSHTQKQFPLSVSLSSLDDIRARRGKSGSKMAPPSRLVVFAFALLLFVALVQVRQVSVEEHLR